MTWIYSLGLLGLIGGTGVAVNQYRTWRQRQEEASMQRFRCPRCEQKLRYHGSRAGQAILCPGCNSRIALPTQPAPILRSERRVGQRLTPIR